VRCGVVGQTVPMSRVEVAIEEGRNLQEIVDAAIADRDDEILYLRQGGYTYRQIVAEVGCTRGHAWHVIQKTLTR
jgi:hypothetical protein